MGLAGLNVKRRRTRGTSGEKLLAGSIGPVVIVAKFATGQIVDPTDDESRKIPASAKFDRLGIRARTIKLGKTRSAEVTKKAAAKSLSD